MLGDNLTTPGLAVDAARVGDRWAVGDEVVLEVTGPRLPCATFAHRMGEPGWLRTFTEVGRSGAYLAIVTGGTVRPGDAVRVLAQAAHDVPLPVVFAAYMGDLEAARVVLAADFLPDAETEWLQERMDRRSH